ncbi:MAG: hypothetical protein QW650_02825 [Thermofilum sp.]
MSDVKAPTAVLLAVLLVLAPLAATVRAENDRSAEVLVENAKRLQLLVHFRNEVIANSSLPLVNATLWATILNLTAEADLYLSLAVEQLAAGNFTLAKNYALSAMRLYGDILELQSEVAEELGLEFKFEGALPLNLTASVSNMTVALNRTALILQLQVLEARVAQLREQLSKVDTSLFDISNALALLDRASEILAEARAALDAGNLTVSDLARMLAEVKRILGLVTAELNRASLHVAIVKAMKLGWLKRNETEYLEDVLINRTLVKKVEKAIRERALNWSEVESVRNATRELVEKVFKEVKSKVEKAAERAGAAAKISIKVKVEKEAPPITPPGWAKKAERGTEAPAPPKQGKGARG